MAVQKLVLDDLLDEMNYALIGIHCSIENYRLAYFLNKYLNIHLTRNENDLDFSNQTQYALFEWFDENKLVTWHLVSNNCKVESQGKDIINSLFNQEEPITKTHHLIPEYKKVNFFLKISDDHVNKTKLNLILRKIQSIPQIVTAYSLDPNDLRSKNNLIFD